MDSRLRSNRGQSAETADTQPVVRIVQRSLMILHFRVLEPSAQLATVKEAQGLIRRADVLRTDKTRLIAFLECYKDWQDEAVRDVVQEILEEWRSAPL